MAAGGEDKRGGMRLQEGASDNRNLWRRTKSELSACLLQHISHLISVFRGIYSMLQ